MSVAEKESPGPPLKTYQSSFDYAWSRFCAIENNNILRNMTSIGLMMKMLMQMGKPKLSLTPKMKQKLVIP